MYKQFAGIIFKSEEIIQNSPAAYSAIPTFLTVKHLTFDAETETIDIRWIFVTPLYLLKRKGGNSVWNISEHKNVRRKKNWHLC